MFNREDLEGRQRRLNATRTLTRADLAHLVLDDPRSCLLSVVGGVVGTALLIGAVNLLQNALSYILPAPK